MCDVIFNLNSHTDLFILHYLHIYEPVTQHLPLNLAFVNKAQDITGSYNYSHNLLKKCTNISSLPLAVKLILCAAVWAQMKKMPLEEALSQLCLWNAISSCVSREWLCREYLFELDVSVLT